MNPCFNRHLRSYDWRKVEYWKLGFRVGFPLPFLWGLFVGISVMFVPLLNDSLLFSESKDVNLFLTKVYMTVPSLVASYFMAKKLMPPLGRANSYDRKTIDIQLALMILVTIYILLKNYLEIL